MPASSSSKFEFTVEFSAVSGDSFKLTVSSPERQKFYSSVLLCNGAQISEVVSSELKAISENWAKANSPKFLEALAVLKNKEIASKVDDVLDSLVSRLSDSELALLKKKLLDN